MSGFSGHALASKKSASFNLLTPSVTACIRVGKKIKCEYGPVNVNKQSRVPEICAFLEPILHIYTIWSA